MKTQRSINSLCLVGTLTILFAVAEAGPARGATLVVTNTSDSGAGSLRQAILSANSTANVPDVINFNIAGAGPHTISPVTPLPAVTDPVVIDGYTQSGASSNTLANGDDAVLKIVVNEGLVINTSNSVIRGLAIRTLTLGVSGGLTGGSNVVEGNFVGLDATGTNSLGGQALLIYIPNNRIGGTAPGARNVISGHPAVGGLEMLDNASRNTVQGNFIGTDRTGTQAIGNFDRAVVSGVTVSSNLIGGTVAGARNVISGNLNRGITLDGSNNIVQGNYIGTDVTGLQPLGNARTGIEVGGPGNLVGGTNSGAGNIIAFNGVNGDGFTTNGVDVRPGATGCMILGNSIFDNAGLGIDVNADGLVTAGYPVLTVVSNTGTATAIRGTFAPAVNFRLELFTNPTADASGNGEGKTLLTSTNLTTDAGGNFGVNWPVPITPGVFITATATTNRTSEFSPARFVTAAGSTNSWTNSISGKWETSANWSLHFPPFIGQSLVLITNAGSKTVNNDATTASAFPSTLTVSNLTIGAPSGATNTLLLAHGGTNTPLRILSALTLNSGGALVISNAAVNLEGNFPSASRIDGALTLNDGSLTVTNFTQIYVGYSGSGSLTISNGTFVAYYPIFGLGSNAVGTWNIAGGNSTVTATFDVADNLNATGRVVMTGGQLETPGCYLGLFGNGSMAISNGNFYCYGQILVGSQPGSAGNFTAAGGSTFAGSIVVSEGPTATGTVLVSSNAEVGTYILDVRTGGTVKMDGGSFTALSLLLSGTSQFIFNQGTLLTQLAAVSNTAPFVVGDGMNSAVLGVFDTNNSFSRGLRIAPNATLTGNGAVIGMVTNSGVIDPGYFGGLVGLLGIKGRLILSNSSDLHFDINQDFQSDFLSTTGSVVLGGKLSVGLMDDFPSVMTNGASFIVMSNNTTLTGAFTNVASGGLLTTTDGYARFTVLYAGANTVRLANLQIVDTDGDGMPDWWEDLHGLDKNVSDATFDLDGDGASNISEFRAGTQPDDSDSVFRIVAIQPETNNVRITWTTVMGRSYRLQTNAPVNGGLSTNYADASPLIAAPSDDTESTTNYVHVGGFTNVPARYYRVRLAP